MSVPLILKRSYEKILLHPSSFEKSMTGQLRRRNHEFSFYELSPPTNWTIQLRNKTNKKYFGIAHTTMPPNFLGDDPTCRKPKTKSPSDESTTPLLSLSITEDRQNCSINTLSNYRILDFCAQLGYVVMNSSVPSCRLDHFDLSLTMGNPPPPAV
jgi:hypothetical protein